ncbi:MAG: sulfite exporter TauE/SafE family protein [Armatimonadetes bacterium]|nr:sulfite exporter TauE/SafE family protein [Armatimonadota bacterium]
MPVAEITVPILWGIAAVSVLAGAFGAMLGLGGGIILVPLLIAVFSVETEAARFASLVAVCVTSLAGSLVYLREGVTDLVYAGYLQLPTIVGAVAGALIGSRLDATVVKVLFAALLLFVAWRLLRAKALPSARGANRGRWMAAGGACLGAGLLSSLLGVGGGLIFVPVLSLLLARPPRVAAATSTYLIGLTAAASALIYARAGQMDANIAVPAALGILVGAQVGARVSRFVPGLLLRRVFAAVMLVNAFLLIQTVLRNG